MTEFNREKKKGEDEVSPPTVGGSSPTAPNILRITDELVRQIDRSKKLVLIMIIAIIVAIPLSWHVSPLLLGTPYNFRIAGIVTIVIAAVFIAVGVRQWMIITSWTRRYKSYKEMQKRVDEELDFERSENRSSEGT